MQQLTLKEREIVEKNKAKMRELAPKLRSLQQFTRPAGKAGLPYEVGIALEKRYGVYAKQFARYQNEIKKIYKNNGMEHL